MKIEKLKIAVQALNATLSHLDRELGQKLRELLKDDQFEEEQLVSSLKKEIYGVLNEFWSSIPADTLRINRLVGGKNSRIKPWLDFQATLSEGGWEDADHPQRFQQLAARFSAKDPLLNVSALLNLLKCATRMLGYVEEKTKKQYPFDRLRAEIDAKGHLPHERMKQEQIVTTLAVVFYLLHYHCTAEQLQLLPLLCDYRLSTTNEERRSEKAVVRYMLEQVLCSQEFFLDYEKDYITSSRDWVESRDISTLAPLLPKNITALKKHLDPLPWSKILLKGMQTENKTEVLTRNAQQLFNDFLLLKKRSYFDAINLASTIQQDVKLPEERLSINALLYIFCLQAYENERKEDPRPDGFFGFSRGTKCSAALKKIDFLTGTRSQLGWRESLALKQGRLGQLIDTFEKNDVQSVDVELK
ncbi:hypothetical protein [Legionella clemsonensis]|uniref:Uncharacterized protein n=1 Tax=Legionella clemsonensis TaxID=1867846 RepID=A0A222P6P2_9GAMM|nr:hypothetical protein [Legionella clemsonensis]ASQ47445.1 hypothetical protein clem_14595 [Legionella clemsonensis]